MARIARLSPTGLRHKLSSLCALKIPLQYHFASPQYFLATSAAAQRNNRSQTITAEGLFTFRLPVGFKESKTGVDSFMRGYQRGRARFIFVCGDSASHEYDEKNMR